MRIRTIAGTVVLLFLAAIWACSQEIAPGTILPVGLNSTLDSRHSKPGQVITGKVMQDVVLPDRASIPKGARVIGHVISVRPATPASPAQMAIAFDQLVIGNRRIAITTHARAVASMSEVFEAKIPTNSLDDYGTSSSDWNTVQVGGAGVYRGNGQVVSGDQVVGRATDYGAVTAKLIAAPASGCRGDEHEQSLWVFSPWSCGAYGFNDLKLARDTGLSGQIELESDREIHIDGGSGWLLRVESPRQ